MRRTILNHLNTDGTAWANRRRRSWLRRLNASGSRGRKRWGGWDGASRLAKDLPRFDSVWIDALAQARVLTPFQAAGAQRRARRQVAGGATTALRAARPSMLRGVVSGEERRFRRDDAIGGCRGCRARAESMLGQLQLLAESGRRCDGSSTAAATERASASHASWGGSSTATPTVRESASHATQRRVDAAAKRCSSTAISRPCDAIVGVRSPAVSPSPPLPLSPSSCLITDSGRDGERLFAASPWIDGRAAAEWVVHHGRFPPQVVLEIARAMTVELVSLERLGICHGDASGSSLLLTDAGDVALALPGLRGILRPEEGYAHADLPPEAFDCLAPERITSGRPPDAASDIYACGCVWWHLLCGRAAAGRRQSDEASCGASGGDLRRSPLCSRRPGSVGGRDCGVRRE